MMKKNYHDFALLIKQCLRPAPLIKRGVWLLSCLLFIAVSASRSFAADFQVQPTTMDLSGSVKSGVFSVINNGNEKIDFQVSVQEWNQDGKGKDVYTDTKDIVFFPKVMSIEANSQRAIRIGLKAPRGTKEKTYRLFVAEIPTPKKTSDVKVEGKIPAGITIAFRFSMPIFVKPARPQESYAVDSLEMSKGAVKAIVKNTGNVHVKLNAVKFSGKAADGKELYSKEVAGWYVLQGLSFPYEAAVPKEVCGKLATIEVSAQTDEGKKDGKLTVEKRMCTQ
ncbi:MAG: molecular chaperone [Smithella sp.]